MTDEVRDDPNPSKHLDERRCQWLSLHQAMHAFATFGGATQSAAHIKPLHWYVASRLVVEGGFRPEEITPHPPFRSERRKGKGSKWLLHFDPAVATSSERTILGGLKTKNVDVVVTKDGMGPVIAVSCKGVTGAYRNLTNRMEETIGECTNLHITYPALALGYFVILRANRMTEAELSGLPDDGVLPERALKANDIAIRRGGEVVEGILRFHSALRELTGRRGIRNDVSRYEAIALELVETIGAQAGQSMRGFPPGDSPLSLARFFQTLYLRYDERFVFGAPDLASVTRRVEWDVQSPALSEWATANVTATLDYEFRTSGSAFGTDND